MADEFDSSGFGTSFGTANTSVWDFDQTNDSNFFSGDLNFGVTNDYGSSPSPFMSWVTSALSTSGGKNIAGGIVMGVGSGILQMLKGNKDAKNAKELLQQKYDLEQQGIANQVARASSMPAVRRMTPAHLAPGSAVPQGWQAPAISATQRGLLSRRN